MMFVQDPYPPIQQNQKNRQASAPAVTRGQGRPISGAYRNPVITRGGEERQGSGGGGGGLTVTSSRMVSICSILSSRKCRKANHHFMIESKIVMSYFILFTRN